MPSASYWVTLSPPIHSRTTMIPIRVSVMPHDSARDMVSKMDDMGDSLVYADDASAGS